MNRAERRRRNKVIYDRRAKLMLRTWCTLVPCTEEELPVHDYRGKMNHRCWRKAESYKDLQKYSPSMHLYKNTGTIWDHGYWTKYERRRVNKSSRTNAKLDLRNGIEEIYDRPNLKI